MNTLMDIRKKERYHEIEGDVKLMTSITSYKIHQ
jgi:hypothetical protein